MKCNCDNTSCIKTKQQILENINERYMPCSSCHSKTLKKAIPLKRQIKLEKIDTNYMRCPVCNKCHIDIVMAHILKIMIESGEISNSASIRKVGMPLITPAIYLQSSPYLPKRSVVIIMDEINGEVAQKIYNEVCEVKAIICGDVNTTIGQKTKDSQINNYELKVGCPIRCDIQNTPLDDPVVVYKNQSKIHIEYPKEISQKIVDVDNALKKYDNPTVLDAMAGPGSLGIYALMCGAKKVVFNDIYPEAIKTTKLNLEVNGFNDPKCYELLCCDIEDIANHTDIEFDVAFIDAFPGIDCDKFRDVLSKIAKDVIII